MEPRPYTTRNFVICVQIWYTAVGAKFGEMFAPHLFQEALLEKQHNSFLLGLMSRHVGEFRECRFTDVRESNV